LKADWNKLVLKCLEKEIVLQEPIEESNQIKSNQIYFSVAGNIGEETLVQDCEVDGI